MNSKLIIKNFGPIKKVDLDLRNVNVFIGPQASGKSVIAKIYTICKAPRKALQIDVTHGKDEVTISANNFKRALDEYNIANYFKPESEISFDSELHSLNITGDSIVYKPKLLKTIDYLELLASDFESKREEIFHEINESEKVLVRIKHILQSYNFSTEDKKMKYPFTMSSLTEDLCSKVISDLKAAEPELSLKTALYIPAERNFYTIIKGATMNLILNKVPIPTHILTFGAEVEKADLNVLNLSFIQKNLFYRVEDGEERISSEGYTIKLSEAASGIQSVVPMLKPIVYHNKNSSHRSFVIEEPELNLFPDAQYGLLKFLESSRTEHYWQDFGSIHTYTTHSPYMLAGFNNLLYAYKALIKIMQSNGYDYGLALDQVSKIVPANIDPDFFTAYQICDGYSESIFDREMGLISQNAIDRSTDIMNEDFSELMEIVNQ